MTTLPKSIRMTTNMSSMRMMKTKLMLLPLPLLLNKKLEIASMSLLTLYNPRKKEVDLPKKTELLLQPLLILLRRMRKNLKNPNLKLRKE